MITIIKTLSAPGSSLEKVLTVKEDELSAIAWLEDNGYTLNANNNIWEHPSDEDYFTYSYAQIRGTTT